MKAQPAVTATRPASEPFSVAVRSHFPVRKYWKNIAASVPPPAPSVVVSTMMLTVPAAPTMPRVEPGLKPYQPNHRIIVPISARPRLCGGMDLPHTLPCRGPRINAPTSAITPPTVCTTLLPAKSKKPCWNSQPPPHTQCTTIG